jgi:steroid delta-isomerase-like uncharacterized protein
MSNRWQWIVATTVLVSMAMPGPLILRASADTAESNRQLVIRHYDLMNSGKWKEAAEMFAPDVRHHFGSWEAGQERTVQGQAAMAGNLEDLYRTFPDWKMEILDMVADSVSVVVRCRVSGTHQGLSSTRMNGGYYMGVKPTGKHFVVQHIHWYKIRDGKIIDHYANRDDLGMTRQLGLLAPPTNPTPKDK